METTAGKKERERRKEGGNGRRKKESMTGEEQGERYGFRRCNGNREREREKVKFLKRVQTEPSFCFVYILCRYEMRD